MDNKIDCIVKDALIDETKALLSTEDIFHRIEEKIKMEEDRKFKDYKHYSLGFGFKKHILIAACLLVVCTTLMFTSSNQVIAFASQTISTIKTIFTLEKVGNELQVVEKPINEAKFFHSVGRITEKSDEELSEKLGFNVRFPEFLGDSFKLRTKSLSVALRKLEDYETFTKLQNVMFNAIEDDNVLTQLKPYNPAMDVSGTYDMPDKSTIFIHISQSWRLSEIESQLKASEDLQGFEKQKVKVGNLDGHWIKALFPDYPLKMENGIGKSDMSVQPEVKERNTLIWEKSSTLYVLNTFIDPELTLEESIKIAEEFMKAN